MLIYYIICAVNCKHIWHSKNGYAAEACVPRKPLLLHFPPPTEDLAVVEIIYPSISIFFWLEDMLFFLKQTIRLIYYQLKTVYNIGMSENAIICVCLTELSVRWVGVVCAKPEIDTIDQKLFVFITN